MRLYGKVWGAGATFRLTTGDRAVLLLSLLPLLWNLLCEWMSAMAKYRQRPEMKWKVGSYRRSEVLFYTSVHSALLQCWALQARACIAEWAFEVSAGKEDPVWSKDTTDLLVEQSREIKHKERSSGSSKWRTLKLMTPSPPPHADVGGEEQYENNRVWIWCHKVDSISKGHLLFISSICV